MIASYDDLIHRITKWSKSQSFVQAVVMVGSRARETYDIDRFSDLDLIVFSESPSELARSETWISTISRPWILDFTQTFAGDAELQVIYEGGYKVDFVITNSRNQGTITQILNDSPYVKVFDRGWKQLHLSAKPTAETATLAGTSLMSAPRPNLAENQTSHTLFLSYGLAKSIFRNDLWRAHNYLCQIRAQLIWFVEMQTRLTSNGEAVTWEDGRYVDRWADQELIKRLPELFPGYHRESLTRTFHLALELFDELAAAVSAVSGEDAPTSCQLATLKWLKEIGSPSNGSREVASQESPPR